MPICYGPEGWTNCGFGEVLAHFSGPMLSHYSPLFWEGDTSETHCLLAAVGTWLTVGLGLELAALAGELEAKLGTKAAPNPTTAWPQPWTSTGGGNRLAH